MRLLLDTHALMWWWLGDPALSDTARAAMESNGNAVFVTPVNALEIAQKVGRGRAPALRETLDSFEDAIARDGFRPLSIDTHHARRSGLLPGEHRDPFDRLIAAQALIEGLTVVTRDRQIAAFGCEVLW
jgi:PIN domain nuclease of toxin-antitoxin system